jgi:hypothetical protein
MKYSELNLQRKQLLLGILSVLVIVLGLLFSPYFFILSAPLAILVYDIVKDTKKEIKKDQVETTEDKMNKGATDINWESDITLEQVFKSLISVRIKAAHSIKSEELLTSIDNLIQSIRDALVALDEIGEKGVTRWHVSRIGLEFLPKLLNRYTMTDAKSDDLKPSIDSLYESTKSLVEKAKENNKAEFESYNRAIERIAEKIK